MSKKEQNIEELKSFMIQFKLTEKTLPIILSVGRQTVRYWLSGDREMPEVYAKLFRLLKRNPKLINEFY